MLELKKIHIYANDIENATIIITYNLESKKAKEFRMWVRDDLASDFEILNIANKLFHYIKFINDGKEIREKNIFRAYQELYSNELWLNYKLETVEVETEKMFKIKPYRNFIEFTTDYLKEFVDRQVMEFTRKANYEKEI
jgi:hypothetical protein